MWMWRNVVWYVDTNISEESFTSIFTVITAVPPDFLARRYRQHAPTNRWCPYTKLHGVTRQNTVILSTIKTPDFKEVKETTRDSYINDIKIYLRYLTKSVKNASVTVRLSEFRNCKGDIFVSHSRHWEFP
jgi:hypothetical protein